MTTKRHYLKIPHTIAPWVPGGARGNWQGDIWSDVTNRGTELVLEYLEPNERGVRSALHGDRYYVEIGRDRERSDAVFLLRVQPADSRLPRSNPIRLKTQLLLWSGGSPIGGDAVDELFNGVAEADEAPERGTADPSPLLLSLLSVAPEALRQKLRPGTDVAEPPDAGEFLQPFRHLRSRYRLDRQLDLSPRQDTLLRTRITPHDLSREERDDLLDAFGFELLNRVALAEESQMGEILGALSTLPINPALRARLWVSTLSSLSIAHLRRELHESALALSVLAGDDGPLGRQWRSVALPQLRDVVALNDAELRDVLADVSDDKAAMAAVVAWSKALVFSDDPEGGITLAAVRPSEVPAIATEPAAPFTPAPGSVADEWVLKLRLPDEAPLENLRNALIDAARGVGVGDYPLSSVSALMSFDSLVADLASRSHEWRTAVGDIGRLEADRQEAERAVTELHRVLGNDADRLVREQFITPDEALEITRILEHPFLHQAPDWLISGDVGETTIEPPHSVSEWAALLVLRPRRQRLQLFCDLATELNEPLAIVWLARPGEGVEPERHLREWFERVRDFLLDLPVEMRGLLGSTSTDFRTFQEDAALLSRLKTDLSPAVWTEVEAEFRDAAEPARRPLLEAYGTAVAFLRDEVPGWEALPYLSVKARAAKELARAGVPAQLAQEPHASAHVTVEHNFLEGRANRAKLLFVASESGEDYGVVSVPLVLETQQPRALSVSLRWDIKGEARSGWSRDWPAPEPDVNEVIAVPFYGWRRQPDGKSWHHCLSARLPIRAPKSANPRLELEVVVLDADTRRPLGPGRILKWESIGLQPVPISVVWGDATEPSYVRDHPIGPQERADSLRDKFNAGGSVAVIAPRRFGKSTLVEYLAKEGARQKLLVPPALVCTKYASASGFDYESFWDELSEHLVDKVGARLKRDTAAPLPNPEAFDAVRTAARKKGYKAIVVLMDEAQLFFSGQRGELGSQLKTLLERHLARTDDAKKVPVLFGVIGLPSLRERAGNDLMGLLNPVETSRMDEAELRPLISKKTTGLQTTRGARQKLVEIAGNLLVLRALLEKLAVRATRDGRVWVNYDDVVAVEEGLKKDLQEGRELTVASYIRDVLNAADRVDDWRPISSLAVAAAWARTAAPGRPDAELHERALDLLNQWCRLSHGTQDHGVRPVYTPELLAQHLQQLRDRQVLDGAEFESPLLRAWLTGVATRSSFDDTFRDSLFSGAQRRIRLPSGASPMAQGGQAAVWRSGEYAYRIRQLSGPQERQHFLESAEMLEVLRHVVQRREAGSDHVFELLDMGLSERNDREAIQVYRWVNGQNLAVREHGLAADMVIEIGAKLARGLRLLHRNNVLHRDICPRNIVLDDVSDPSMVRPVLIDFGFARLASMTTHTAITGEHIAPEARAQKPEWGRAADVYALASTLDTLLDPVDTAADLRALLGKAMADKPDERPTTEQLLEALETLETDHEINDRREQAWRDLWASVTGHRHIPWFSGQMNKVRESLVNVTLGFYRIPLQRYGVVTDFLNQLTEAGPAVRTSLWTLGTRQGDETLRTAGAIRNQHVHGRGNQQEEQRIVVQRFEGLQPEHQKAQVRRAAERIAELCQLKALPTLVDLLLR